MTVSDLMSQSIICSMMFYDGQQEAAAPTSSVNETQWILKCEPHTLPFKSLESVICF